MATVNTLISLGINTRGCGKTILPTERGRLFILMEVGTMANFLITGDMGREF